MIDLTPFAIALLTLIGTLITSLLVPYIRSKTTAQQQETIKMWVTIAVTAAEQLYKGTGRGEEKKQYVIDFLTKQGFKVDIAAIDALIESAVFELPESFSEKTNSIGINTGEAV